LPKQLLVIEFNDGLHSRIWRIANDVAAAMSQKGKAVAQKWRMSLVDEWRPFLFASAASTFDAVQSSKKKKDTKNKKHKRNGLQKRRIKSVLFVAAAFVRFRVFLLLFSVHFQIVSLALYAVLFNSFFTFFAVVVWGCKCAIKETGYTPINLEMLATSSPPFVAIVSTWLKCSHNVAAAAAAKMYSYSYSHVLMLTAFL